MIIVVNKEAIYNTDYAIAIGINSNLDCFKIVMHTKDQQFLINTYSCREKAEKDLESIIYGMSHGSSCCRLSKD